MAFAETAFSDVLSSEPSEVGRKRSVVGGVGCDPTFLLSDLRK